MSEYSEIGNNISDFDFGVTSLDEDTESEQRSSVSTCTSIGSTVNEKSSETYGNLSAVPSILDSVPFSSSIESIPAATESNTVGTFRDRFKKLIPHRQAVDLPSPLHYKLHEANQRWWSSLHSKPEIISKDIQSTTKRIGVRLDKTQQLAIANSNQTRQTIAHLKACSTLIDNIAKDGKVCLPALKLKSSISSS